MKEALAKIFTRYQGRKDELIPILQEAQEHFRYLPEEAMKEISRFLRVPESTIYGVSTFYALFKLKPAGKRVIRVCRGTACHVRGGGKILAEIEKELGICAGETTPDMEYTIETISCFGSCALAPVMVIDKTVYGRMAPAKVKEILKSAK
ncbi:MAG: NADH-quinone oxidoreductase subunit NuoE [Chloroflexi bacterium]|nr:NADH-quinone oxidoreductase subunit NuoE [Chloroflexota bacterium]